MDKELLKKLSKYSAAAAAVVGTAGTANGQIVYNQINKTLTSNQVDSVDIVTDGNYDLIMGVLDYTASSGPLVVLGAPMNSQGHAMAGSAPSGYNYPFKLNAGTSVKNQQFLPADSLGSFLYIVSSSTPWSSFWQGGVTDGYLGMKLSVGGNTHYGWVRMDMAADGSQVVIKDCAYESTANGDINTGAGINIEEFANIANSMWIHEKTLHTEFLVEFDKAQINIMDMSGKVVESIDVIDAKATYDVSHLSSGTYVVSLSMDENVINKKDIIR